MSHQPTPSATSRSPTPHGGHLRPHTRRHETPPRRQHSPEDGGPQATRPTPPKAAWRHTERQPVPGRRAGERAPIRPNQRPTPGEPPPRHSAHGARRTQPADQPPLTRIRKGKNHRPPPHTPTQHNSRGGPRTGKAPPNLRHAAHTGPCGPPRNKAEAPRQAGGATHSSTTPPSDPGCRRHPRAVAPHPRPPRPGATTITTSCPPDRPTPKLTHPTQPCPPPRRKPQLPPPVPRADRNPPTPNPAGEQAPEQRKRRRGERDSGTESKGIERQKNTQAPSPTGPPDVYGGGRRAKSNSPGSRGHPERTHAHEEAPKPPRPPHKPREILVYSLINVLVKNGAGSSLAG
ncbi:basic salivary proline-rich protein 4-like [Gouania willdenowi]|uniref:basic salivary proline-rich protein 4-like n=1 Tax=Gouania willdenowi TaxID=441366 RepID=UPI001056CBC1|nr:basic salivary proline-rich protein 4-like [Gouania willdenowi]